MKYDRFSEMSATNREEVEESVRPVVENKDAQGRQIMRFQRPSEAYIAARIRDKDEARVVWDRVVMRWLKGGFKKYDKGQPFRPYLVTVIKNEIYRYLREAAGNRENEMLDEAAAMQPEAEAERAFDDEWGKMTLREALESVRCDIDELSEVHKHIVEFVKDHGREPTTEEISLKFGISREAARQRKSRSQQRIRRKVIENLCAELATRSYRQLEDELDILSLLPFCKDELAAMRDKGLLDS